MTTRLSPARLLLIFALVLAPLYAWYYRQTGTFFSSPDERTVSVFVTHWAETNSFHIARTVPNDTVFPRSVATVGNDYAPTGFLGLFLLLGLLQRFFGASVVWLFVPALAALTPLALYTLWRRLFSERIAFLSAIFCGVFPAFAYYASRGLLPNIAFVSLVICSIALADQGIKKSGWLARAYCLVAGLTLGCGLIIRPIEAIWVLPVLITLWWWAGKPTRLFLGALTALLPLVWLGYWQQATYGSWYAVGYAPSLAAHSGQAGASLVWQTFMRAWFPFGFHPFLALQRLAKYAFFVYWWALPFALVGFVALIKQFNKNAAYKKYSLLFLGVFLYLGSYYGSWTISDHPDQDWITIGVAYNRYWLPLFILAMPFLADGIFVVSRKIKAAAYAPAVLVSFLLFASIATTFAFGPDSLWAMAGHGVEYKQLQDFVGQRTGEQAIIVAGREEKVLWPMRQVLYASDDSFDFVDRLPALARTQPVFWLTTLPTSYVLDAEQRFFTPVGLQLTPVDVFDAYRLYLIR